MNKRNDSKASNEVGLRIQILTLNNSLVDKSVGLDIGGIVIVNLIPEPGRLNESRLSSN